MKIEIDLNDILGDEYGTETLQESVRRQVIDNLTYLVSEGIGKRIDRELSEILDKEIRKAVTDKMPLIMDDLLKAEYVQADRYGHSTGKATNFREQLVKAINDQMVYSKGGYSSDKNMFTKSVDSVIEEQMRAFKEQFIKQVDAEFCQEAMDYATKKLKERLGIKQ